MGKLGRALPDEDVGRAEIRRRAAGESAFDLDEVADPERAGAGELDEWTAGVGDFVRREPNRQGDAADLDRLVDRRRGWVDARGDRRTAAEVACCIPG